MRELQLQGFGWRYPKPPPPSPPRFENLTTAGLLHFISEHSDRNSTHKCNWLRQFTFEQFQCFQINSSVFLDSHKQLRGQWIDYLIHSWTITVIRGFAIKQSWFISRNDSYYIQIIFSSGINQRDHCELERSTYNIKVSTRTRLLASSN